MQYSTLTAGPHRPSTSSRYPDTTADGRTRSRRSAQLIWARSNGAVVARTPGRVRPGRATVVSRVTPGAGSDNDGTIPPVTRPLSRAGVITESGGSTQRTGAYLVIAVTICRSVPGMPSHGTEAIQTRWRGSVTVPVRLLLRRSVWCRSIGSSALTS